MARKNLLSLVFWLVHVSLTVVVSAQECLDSLGTFKPGGTFDNNRQLILSSLASEVTARDGFFNASIGTDPDQVYAMGICIPGAKQEICSDCIKDASDQLVQSCPNQTAAFYWSGGGETQSFDGLFERLSVGMVNKASSSSGNDVSVSNSRFYVVDVARLSSSEMVYALVQCTPDVSSSNCKTCLQQSVDDYKDGCRGKKGSFVYRPNCIFRLDIMIGIGAIIGIVTATVIIIALLALGAASLGDFFPDMPSSLRWSCSLAASADDITTAEYLHIDIKEIEAAKSNFLASNKIGQGGFGEVYKGTFANGTEVAVKRLSRTSDQGEVEFENEVLLVAKLQHRTLVRLLGFSLKGEENILVYEFVPNKSLDYLLFGNKQYTKKGQLDWTRRYNIIGGITRGLLYLHQDSRLTIIHRDIKASNILLDADMNPKIADFGMARNFRDHQTEANTGRVVGTFGYMSPEYVTHGQFSTKSDVCSYGVLILEIVIGKRNSSFYQRNSSVCNLVTYPLDVGLLCVQETPADRPAMSTVFQMLTNSSITLPVPRPPPGQSSSNSVPCSVDNATITMVTPR
ncbi:hypothetical protein EUTSA_v10028545mg [Eutrema salsugineum]|uniref:Uncharacterized protein n=1 Tax=Eutrema salsugineum TaxID=72664 RepID=V4KKF7_EUTSA|nr:hypothetical protein EUTSA_v10028545mg [Eutrema salsugineum]